MQVEVSVRMFEEIEIEGRPCLRARTAFRKRQVLAILLMERFKDILCFGI
jgi:hypothetical protein